MTTKLEELKADWEAAYAAADAAWEANYGVAYYAAKASYYADEDAAEDAEVAAWAAYQKELKKQEEKQNPTGAMWAIHKQAIRIEDLEAALAAAADAIEVAIQALEGIMVDPTWGLEHETYMRCRAALRKLKETGEI